MNVMGSGKLPLLWELARRHPDTQVVVDHVDLRQSFEPPHRQNRSPKLFPYPDIWEPLGQVFDAFGFERCMWGTDWTRAVGLLTYEQGVEAFRVTDQLSDAERAALMGKTLAKIYNWSPDMGG